MWEEALRHPSHLAISTVTAWSPPPNAAQSSATLELVSDPDTSTEAWRFTGR